MARTKKNKLEIDYSYDFELIGLRTSAKGYRLAWELNGAMGWRLTRQDDLAVQTKSGDHHRFGHYAYDSGVGAFRLFRNKPTEGDTAKAVLVPEFAHYDYILYCQTNDKPQDNRLQEVLRNIPSIELAAFIPLDALKTKDVFIF
ncbi:MAG: IPExxxVDY family protein [Cyclobacteriaceae bacterium]|jgi:hypothetical protein|nr:IPExxxVDY family protein [Cyclobacteriaceae bacterium]